MKGKASLLEGKILFASGNPEASIPFFTAALAQGADPVTVCLSRGSASMALQRFTDAKEDFTLVINADPHNERAYYFRGIAEIALRQYETAIEDLTRSLTKNHNRGIAYLVRGLAYAELGNEKDAQLDFNSASNFSRAELHSFLKVFDNHPEQRNKTMKMLMRQSAPWKALLSQKEAETIRKTFSST